MKNLGFDIVYTGEIRNLEEYHTILNVTEFSNQIGRFNPDVLEVEIAGHALIRRDRIPVSNAFTRRRGRKCGFLARGHRKADFQFRAKCFFKSITQTDPETVPVWLIFIDP